MRKWFLGLAAALACGGAGASERAEFNNLRAPPPAALRPMETAEAVKPVAFARVLVQIPTSPWARVEVIQANMTSQVEYVSWDFDRGKLDQAALQAIFAEELKAANIPTEGGRASVFGDTPTTDLQVGAIVTGMKGRLCKSCGLLTPWSAWVGVVNMEMRWEVHSRFEDKVLVAVETRGGYATPSRGIGGEPLRLVQEAFRDNVRRLIASDEFRRTLTGSASVTPERLTQITFTGAPAGKQPIAKAAEGAAAIFAADGHGTGFLISGDGYLLTNHHVVGGAKYVKVRWSDRTETLGEVVRSDRRRDVALIKVGAQGRRPLALRSAAASLGEPVFAVGTPLDARFQGTVTKGIVSSNRTYDGQTFIQSDVNINPGNSGGPLLDEAGAVIGLAVSGYRIGDAPTGLNLFIPIGDALDALALKPVG